jgi:hypothetical protein
MNSKMKGDISEARALFEFLKLGVPVSLPYGDNQRYDMIAEFNGKLNRIQVKTANQEENGSIICRCASSTNHTTNKREDVYTNQIDYFVFYNQKRDLIALVPIEETRGAKTIHLRIEPTKNNQKEGIRFFKDFSFKKFIKEV